MKVTGITRIEIQEIIDKFKKFSSTYFWTPPSTAAARRYQEEKNSFSNVFLIDGTECECSLNIICSAKNYYAKPYVNYKGTRVKYRANFLKKLLKEGEFNDDQG